MNGLVRGDIKLPSINSWSYSRLVDFESCRLKAKLKYIDRVPDPRPSPAADRGTAIHTEAEDYVKGEGKLTANLLKFKAEFEAMRNRYAEGQVSLEGEWGFTQNWEVTTWKSAWGRIKADNVTFLSADHAAVVDYKTGKKFGNEIKHGEQTQLYALGTFLRNPKIQVVTAELWYLDIDEITQYTITRAQSLGKHLKYYDKRARIMTQANRFDPNPNIHSCKWCPYGPKGTGHCQVGFQP